MYLVLLLAVVGNRCRVDEVHVIVGFDDTDVLRFAACPLCHTTASLTESAVEAGDAWRCVRCGQQWDATRLTAVAAYAAWVLARKTTGAVETV